MTGADALIIWGIGCIALAASAVCAVIAWMRGEFASDALQEPHGDFPNLAEFNFHNGGK